MGSRTITKLPSPLQQPDEVRLERPISGVLESGAIDMGPNQDCPFTGPLITILAREASRSKQ